MKLILASGSPRRKELLSLAGLDYLVEPAQVEEIVPAGTLPEEESEYLALLKASAVGKLHPEAVVLGADTTVLCEGKVLGKPKNREEAGAMLRFLSGKTHLVCSGVALVRGEKALHFTSRTEVTFYELKDEEINAYLDTGEPFDKAGAYGIQGRGALLVKEIRGDYLTVVGLPLAETVRALRKFERL